MFGIKCKRARARKQDRSAKKATCEIADKSPPRSNQLYDRCENAERRERNIRT
jgi:hypothetical protein